MDWLFEREVNEKIQYRPRLIPVFSHTHDIPERLYDYNPRLFLCLNRVSQKFEVHHLDQPDSYCFSIKFDELDARVIRHVWENDIGVHGDSIFKRIEESERNFERQKEREYRNFVRDMASETQSMFAKDAWK